MKVAREKEQATAREQIEELRLKLQREKNQELQVCCGSLAMSRPSPLLGEGRFSGCVLLPVPPPQSLRDRLTKDFKTQLRAVQKRHDDAMQTAQTEWKKERQDMREKLREELQTQVLETTPLCL